MGGNFDWAGISQGVGSAGQHYMAGRERRSLKKEREEEKKRQHARLSYDLANDRLRSLETRISAGGEVSQEEWDTANEERDKAVGILRGQPDYSTARKPVTPVRAPAPSPNEPTVAPPATQPTAVAPQPTPPAPVPRAPGGREVAGDVTEAVVAPAAASTPVPAAAAPAQPLPAPAPALTPEPQPQGKYIMPTGQKVSFEEYARINNIQVPPEIMARLGKMSYDKALQIVPQYRPTTKERPTVESLNAQVVDWQEKIYSARSSPTVQKAWVERAQEWAKGMIAQYPDLAPAFKGIDFSNFSGQIMAEETAEDVAKTQKEARKQWAIQYKEAQTQFRAALASNSIGVIAEALRNFNSVIAAGKENRFISAGAKNATQEVIRWLQDPARPVEVLSRMPDELKQYLTKSQQKAVATYLATKDKLSKKGVKGGGSGGDKRGGAGF